MLAKLVITFVVAVTVGAVLMILDVQFPIGMRFFGGSDASGIAALATFVFLGWMLMGKEVRL